MNSELVAGVADAVAAVPGVAYLSPNLRSLRAALWPGSATKRGVSVHATEHGYTVEIRITVRSGHSTLAVARAARDAAAVVLGAGHGANTRISVAVTAII